MTGGHRVARIEELGPVVADEVREWLMQPYSPDRVCPRIRIQPVLDAETVRPVDRYEWPAATSELATVRTPCEVFPWGTLSSRKADDHRLKTDGGWTLRHPEPGVYLWRTPHGHWFRLDGSGSHHVGRDPEPRGGSSSRRQPDADSLTPSPADLDGPLLQRPHPHVTRDQRLDPLDRRCEPLHRGDARDPRHDGGGADLVAVEAR